MNYFFDAVIVLFLLTDGALIVRFVLRSRMAASPRTGWRRKINVPAALLFFAAILAWALVAYGSFIEPRLLVVTRQKIQIGGSGNSGGFGRSSSSKAATLHAALISDFHTGPYKKDDYIEKIVAKTLALKPDVIFIAGDNLYGGDTDEIRYLAPLKKLSAPMGVFAILGNHDYGEGPVPFTAADEVRAHAVRAALEQAGIKVLVNESQILKIGPKRLYLLGLDEYWTGRDNMDAAILSLRKKGVPWAAAHPNILLVHNPDEVRVANASGVDLVLAAHTHGGQIRLPFVGPIPPIPDELGRKYDRGLFTYGKTKLFITSGVGESGPRARLFVPPEIALLEITF